MSVQIALLRGVNLGSRQVVMGELRAACEKAGCEGVRTLLASGNVVLKAKSEGEALEKMLVSVTPPDPEIRFEHRLLFGDPADELVALAEREQADMIVMSTHGRTGLMRFLIFLGRRMARSPFSFQKATSGCDSKIRARNSGRAISTRSISRILEKMPNAWIETPRGGSDVSRATALARRWAAYQSSTEAYGPGSA